MKGNTKKRKVVGVLRAVFADNLSQALDRRYPHSTNKAKSLEQDSGVTDSTIGRWLRHEVSPNLDQLEQVARALRLLPHQMLMPMFGVGGSPDPLIPISPPQPGRSKGQGATLGRPSTS